MPTISVTFEMKSKRQQFLLLSFLRVKRTMVEQGVEMLFQLLQKKSTWSMTFNIVSGQFARSVQSCKALLTYQDFDTKVYLNLFNQPTGQK